jgi:hypothetical protein
MKYALLALCAGVVVMASVHEASAIVCARGVARAGCVGARGAVVVRRPAAVAPVVVAPRPAVRCAIVNGVRVCR